ncbi:MAG: hypothetical protein RR313_08285 [Anaerovoracaceae bacterium]
MQSILEELFYGKIKPNERSFIRKSEYGKAIKTVSDCEEKLLTLLSGKELELFENLMKMHGESSHINGREYFVDGFRLGARIALEIMEKNDGCIIDIIG